MGDPMPSNNEDPFIKIYEFMDEFLQRSFRVGSSKWSRMMGNDAQRLLVTAFVEGYLGVNLIYTNIH